MSTTIPADLYLVSPPEDHATDPRLVVFTLFFRDDAGSSRSLKCPTNKGQGRVSFHTGRCTITLDDTGKIVDWTWPK